jgi:GNAT superfamily N-acetyltransferase
MTATATLRHFNRTYTQRIGVLEESFLGLGMPLAAARPPDRRVATADLLVRAATVQLRTVDPRSAMATQAVEQYFVELNRRFPGGFDAGTARAADAAAIGDGTAVFVVASSDGLPVACGGLQPLTATTGEIKRMWVHPEWRERGSAPECCATSKPWLSSSATRLSGWIPTAP